MIDLLSVLTIVSIYLYSVQRGALSLHISQVVELHGTELVTHCWRWLVHFCEGVDDVELDSDLSM